MVTIANPELQKELGEEEEEAAAAAQSSTRTSSSFRAETNR